MSRQQVTRWSVVIALCLLISGLTHYFFLSNFHSIITKKVYRSGQLSPVLIDHVLTHYKIKTIINLRGQNETQRWYQQEMRASQANHLEHIDIRLSSAQLPEPQELIQLVDSLINSKDPMLIHCESGADRSGFAAAIIKILHGSNLIEAKRQFSWRYYGFKAARIGDLSFEKYEHWLNAHQLTHSREHFLTWVHAHDRYVF